jgi:hypothetical protein
MKIRTLALALVLGLGLTAAGEAATNVKKSHIAKARVKGNRSSNAKKAAKRNKARAKSARKAHRSVKHS